MQKNSYHIAISGGGIIGKACALLLADLGLDIAWVAPTSKTTDRVYALSASTQSLLTQLRVWPTLPPERRQAVSAMEIFTQSATRALHFSAYTAAVPELAWIAYDQDIQQGLDTALRFAKGITPFNCAAQTLKMTDHVELGLENGKVLQAMCLIGADGANSWVRTQAGIHVSVQDYQQTAIVAHFAAEKPHHGVARQWFINGEILALLPLPNNQLSIVWSARPTHAQTLLNMDQHRLAAYLQGTADVMQYTGTLSGLTPPTGYPLSLKSATRLVAPHIALVGDAAHVLHPLAGQGINLGLRDVATLGKIFAEKENFRDYGDMRLLNRYARARALDIKLMMGVTDSLQRCFATPGNVLAKLCGWGLRTLDKTDWIKNILIKNALG